MSIPTRAIITSAAAVIVVETVTTTRLHHHRSFFSLSSLSKRPHALFGAAPGENGRLERLGVIKSTPGEIHRHLVGTRTTPPCTPPLPSSYEQVNVLDMFELPTELLPYFFVLQTLMMDGIIPWVDMTGLLIGYLWQVKPNRSRSSERGGASPTGAP